MNYKRLLMVMVLLFLLAACGNDDDNGDEPGYYMPDLTDMVTLSISIPEWEWVNEIVFEAARRLEADLAHQGLGLHFTPTLYYWQQRYDYFELLKQIMAEGGGPDIFSLNIHPLPAFADAGLVQNLYDLIDRDPYYTRDDFFANVLQSYEIDGRLYTLPLEFGFEFIGINANVPQVFIDRFISYDFISATRLMALYLDSIREYPEFAERHLGFGITPGLLMQTQLHHFMNADARTAHFNDDLFTTFLANLRRVYDITAPPVTPFEWPMENEETMLLLSMRYVFSRNASGLDAINAFLPFDEPVFAHHRPLADEDGRLINLTPPYFNFSINANADGDLAWAFLQHMIAARAEMEHWGDDFRPAIRRDLFDMQITASMENAMAWERIRPFYGQGDSAAEASHVAAVIERIAGYAAMPIVTPLSRFFMPQMVYAQVLNGFMRGEYTTLTATRGFQENVTHFLQDCIWRFIPENIPTALATDSANAPTDALQYP